jgi:membrane protein DedA with SNARE-associated domain
MSTPLPGFLSHLAPILDHYGYFAVGGLIFLEDFGVPAPGETILIAASVYAGAGRLNIVAVGVLGTLAALLGDNLGYAIGRFGGHALVLRFGRYVMITEERLAKAEGFFRRHGGKIIVIARFIEGLRQLNGIIAGIAEMPWLRFVMFNALGAALWVGLWTSVGYLAGNHIQTIYTEATRYSLYLLIAAGVAAVALIVRAVIRRRRRRRQPATQPATPQNRPATPQNRPATAVAAGTGTAPARPDGQAATGTPPAPSTAGQPRRQPAPGPPPAQPAGQDGDPHPARPPHDRPARP